MFHVTSSRNRASIAGHGLDWELMGAASGIAGSRAPEAEGVFLCRDDFERDWFVLMNNTGGPVDVWLVEGIEDCALVDNGRGREYLPGKISPASLTLVQSDIGGPDS